MIYKFDLNQPIFFLWAGLFTNAEGMIFHHRETQHSENFQAFLAIKNDIILNINGEVQTIRENEFYLVPPNSIIKSAMEIDYELSFYWFHFIGVYEQLEETDSLIQSGITDVAELKNDSALNNFALLPEKYLLSRPESIIVQINQLLNNIKLYKYTQRGNDFFLILLLIAVSDDYLKSMAEKQRNRIKKTALVAEWIRVNISQEMSLSSIANHFGLNASYLSRVFKEEQGISVKSYILSIKLDFAKRMLTTTNLPINEVAEQSFFYDAKHFMRLFKQKNGITPTQYRNQNSHLKFNSGTMDPPDPIPSQFGNKALRKMLYTILEENKKLE